MDFMSLEENIKKALLEDIAPRIQMDGGDIEFVELTENNIVKIELKGACVGCMSANMTLKMGVERYLKLKFPEVQGVEHI